MDTQNRMCRIVWVKVLQQVFPKEGVHIYIAFNGGKWERCVDTEDGITQVNCNG